MCLLLSLSFYVYLVVVDMSTTTTDSDSEYDYYDYYDYDQENEVTSDTTQSDSEASDQSSDTESEQNEENEENEYDSGYYYDYDYPGYEEQDDEEGEEEDDDEEEEGDEDEEVDKESEYSTTTESDEESGEEEEERRQPRRRTASRYTKTSQCSFQDAPKTISNGYIEAFLAHATPYIDTERDAVRSDVADDDSRNEMLRCVYYYAEQFECVSGNWLAFLNRERADEVWPRIRKANEKGSFAGYVEMRTARGNDVVVAAHIPDYRDIGEASRVLRALQVLGLRVTTFKPTLLTTLGVYRDRHEHTKYTYAELGLNNSPVPPEIADLIPSYNAAKPNRNNRRRNRKRGGGGGGHQYHPVYHYTNQYYHGRYHTPSLPNGTWLPEEEGQFIYHTNRPTYVAGRGSGGNEDYGHALARGYLENHRERVESGEVVTAREKRELMATLWQLADSYDVVIGKWTVFVKAAAADQVWLEICGLNDAGLLGGSIKCSPYNERSDGFAIFVYCNDFTDTDDCERILRLLSEVCARYGVGMIANFKPDFFTQLGIYRSNLRGYPVQYPLNQLGLAKHWPNRTLKHILDRVKRG